MIKLDEREKMIVAQSKGKSVVHIGCADWPYTARRFEEGRLLHDRISEVATKVIGVDLDNERLAPLRDRFPDQTFLTIEEFANSELDVDVVIAGEVIEHVPDPGEFLRSIRSSIVKGSELFLTTPNAQSIKSAMRGLVGKEYQHPDHVVLFSTATMTKILTETGWKAKHFDYYWATPSTFTGKVSAGMFKVLGAVSSKRSADGLVVSAISQ